MAGASASLLRHLDRLAASHTLGQLTDHQLLERFAAQRDEAAFAALVQRHGPMVLGVCRRALGHEQDAEDAFQAAFLILARKAGSIRQRDMGGFLYRVSYHLALRARANAAKRKQRDKRGGVMSSTDPLTDAAWQDVRGVVDEELQCLPDAPRSAVVLCYLEGKTHDEAARLLGWSKGTLRRRLSQGRELLRVRLLARGLAPAAALTASLFAEGSAQAAVSAALAGATVRTALNTAPIAPAVAALVDAGYAILSVSKTKIATMVLLTASLLGGAGLWICLGVAAPPPVAPAQSAAAKASDKPATDPPKRQEAQTVEVQGRVLDPDGKPKAGAKLLLLSKSDNVKSLGVSAADGRFTIAVPKGVKEPYLIAQSDGNGFDFFNLDSLKRGKPVELRLVKDHAIRGRVVNTEGKPIRGVRVTAGEIATYLNNSLDSFTAAWMNLHRAHGSGLGTLKHLYPGAVALFAATTDADGRFTLRGIGGERTVRLHFRGGGIADTEAWVVNRAGFDPKPYNEANMEPDRHGMRSGNWRWFVLSGPDFSVVTEAEKVIRGVVKDADSGKGRPGLEVLLTHYKDEPLQDTPKAKTDAEGRYEIHGARKAKSYLLVVPCDSATATMTSQVWADDTADYRPVNADIKVKKGVIVTGKVIDKSTGEALPAFVMAAVLQGNPFVKDYPKFAPLFMAPFDAYDRVEAGGTFRLVTIPGPVLLMGKPEGRSRILYKWEGADPKYPQYFDNGGFSAYNYFALLQGSCKVLEIKPGVAEVKHDFVLKRQKVLTMVHIQDAEGRPVVGAWVVANGDKFWVPYGLQESGSCSIFGEAADKPQRLVVYQPARKLAGTRMLKGDEKQPLVVKLGPAGAIQGRLLDAEGKPLAEMVVDLRYRDDAAEEIHKRVHEGKEIVTDAKGAFAFDEVIPELKFELTYRRGKHHFERTPKPADPTVEVKLGESRDLGAITLTQASEKAAE